MTVEKRHDGFGVAMAALAVFVAFSAAPLAAAALDSGDKQPAWYVVGDIDHRGAAVADVSGGYADRMAPGDDVEQVSLGLTLTNATTSHPLGFGSQAPGAGPDDQDRFTFLVSGAYDWQTGTIVTPRFMAGVGLSYYDADAPSGRNVSALSDGGEMAPAMHLGLGADFAITGSLGLSAEYRAFYRGATEVGGTERDPQIDQKFMLGAKIRF